MRVSSTENMDRARTTPLLELKLKLISACDYACQMCGHWREPVHRLTTAQALGAVEDAAKLGARSLILSGGEPTLHKGLVEIVAYAARRGLRVTLATNGGGLAEEKLQALVEAGVAQFNVSVDSPDPALHDAQRGVPGSFTQIFEGARRAAALGRPIAVKTVVTKSTHASLVGAARLAALAPLHSLSFTLVTANEPGMEALRLDQDELAKWFFEALPTVLEEADARGLRVKLFPIFSRWTGLKGAKLAHALREHGPAARRPSDIDEELAAFAQGRYGHAFAGKVPCPVLRGKALVRPEGGVYFCCEVSHTSELEMGTLTPMPGHPRLSGPTPVGLADTWHSPHYAALRASSPRPVHDKCWSCTEWFSRPPEVLLKRANVKPARNDQAPEERRADASVVP